MRIQRRGININSCLTVSNFCFLRRKTERNAKQTSLYPSGFGLVSRGQPAQRICCHCHKSSEPISARGQRWKHGCQVQRWRYSPSSGNKPKPNGMSSALSSCVEIRHKRSEFWGIFLVVHFFSWILRSFPYKEYATLIFIDRLIFAKNNLSMLIKSK